MRRWKIQQPAQGGIPMSIGERKLNVVYAVRIQQAHSVRYRTKRGSQAGRRQHFRSAYACLTTWSLLIGLRVGPRAQPTIRVRGDNRSRRFMNPPSSQHVNSVAGPHPEPGSFLPVPIVRTPDRTVPTPHRDFPTDSDDNKCHASIHNSAGRTTGMRSWPVESLYSKRALTRRKRARAGSS